MKPLSRTLLVFALVMPINLWAQGQSSSSLSEKEKVSILTNSIIYGVFAGAVVGLAVSTDLQNNLQAEADLKDIARGASYGLYGGLLLGTYVAYFLGDGSSPEPEPIPFDEPIEEEPAYDGNPTYEDYEGEDVDDLGRYTPRINISPQFNHEQMTGGIVMASWAF